MNSKRIITYAANSVNLIFLGMAGNQCRAALFCIYKSKSASHLIFADGIEWNKLVDSFDSIWYNKGRKGWRLWWSFFPSYENQKGLKAANHLRDGWRLTSTSWSLNCDRVRSRPIPRRLSCKTKKSFQSQTWHHLLRFCRASEVKKPSAILFLPANRIHGRMFSWTRREL